MSTKQFAILISITFVVCMIWLGADIAFNTKASIPVSDKLQTLLEPVNPNFNPRVLEIIEKEVAEEAPTAVSQVPIASPSTESTESGLTTP